MLLHLTAALLLVHLQQPATRQDSAAGAVRVTLERVRDEPWVSLSVASDGDPIAGVLLGSAVNNDGQSSGFLATPGQHGQEEMLRRAYDDAGVARLKAHVATLWPELVPHMAHLERADQLNRARYRDVVLRQPHREALVVIGDAAHAMSPQLGQGVNMALLDAAALAACLDEHPEVERALQAYRKERHAHVRIYQRMSRWLTPLFQSDYTPLGWCRDLFFGPVGKAPGARGSMLSILTGEAGHRPVTRRSAKAPTATTAPDNTESTAT